MSMRLMAFNDVELRFLYRVVSRELDGLKKTGIDSGASFTRIVVLGQLRNEFEREILFRRHGLVLPRIGDFRTWGDFSDNEIVMMSLALEHEANQCKAHSRSGEMKMALKMLAELSAESLLRKESKK